MNRRAIVALILAMTLFPLLSVPAAGQPAPGTPGRSAASPSAASALSSSASQYAGLPVTASVNATLTLPATQVEPGNTLVVRLHLEIAGTLQGGLCPPGSSPRCYQIAAQPATAVQNKGCDAVAFLGSASDVGAYPSWGFGPGTIRYLGANPTFSNSVRNTPPPGVADLGGVPCSASEVRAISTTITQDPAPANYGYVNRFVVVSDAEYRYQLPPSIPRGTYALGLFFVPNEAGFSFARFAWWGMGQLPSVQVGSAQSAPPTSVLKYVALGDSYSAGEGLARYLPGTDDDGNKCHRSAQSYPALLAAERGLVLGSQNFRFAACSGARLSSYATAGFKGEPAQRDVLREVQPDLVTISIGGNDLEWSSLLISCMSVAVTLIGPYEQIDPEKCYQGTDKQGRPSNINNMAERIDGDVIPALRIIYDQMLVDAGPKAQIRVLLYPPLLPDRGSSTADCRFGIKAPRLLAPVLGSLAAGLPELKAGVNDQVARRFVAGEQYFNNAVRALVNDIHAHNPDAAARLQVVDLETQWGGYRDASHTISCGERGRPEPWINALRMDATELALPGSLTAKLKEALIAAPGSFHPTTSGQQAMASAVERTLSGRFDSAASLTLRPLSSDISVTVTPGPYSRGQRVTVAAVTGGKTVIGWVGKGWKAVKNYRPTLIIAAGGVTAQATTPAIPLAPWGATLELEITGTEVVIEPITVDRPVFGDVSPATTGAAEPIAQLAARGVIKGCDQSVSPPLFCPGDPTLRAQMAALLVRAMGWSGEAPANPFADRDGVDDELWRAVAILADHGVARGYGDGTYGTTGPVLNAQVISFIARAMMDAGYWEPQPADAGLYPNVPLDSGHRVDLATYAFYAGPVRGADDTGGAFAGWDQPSSRAYFSFALWQALDSYFGAPAPASAPPASAPPAAQHQNGAAYATWRFQGAGDDFWNVDQVLWVAQKADHTFWAMQFRFPGAGDAGYLGLQTDGNRFDGTQGELAIFSLWNANGARGGACGTFSGQGDGFSCRLPMAIAPGQRYRLRLWRLEADADGQWWGAWVSDGATDRHIGAIRVPAAGHQVVGDVLNFSEYWGPAVPCDRVPRSIVELTQPAANSRGDQSYNSYSALGGYSRLNCAGGLGVPKDYGWTQGIELVLGDGPPGSAP